MILSFEKPKKIRTTEQHNSTFSSDSGVAGTYVPNMSDADREKWKAKHIKGDDERVEIRKTIGGTQLLIVVYKNAKYHKEGWRTQPIHNEIQVSANGKIQMSFQEILFPQNYDFPSTI